MVRLALKLAVFIALASCAAVREYEPGELTVRREMKFANRTKDELYVQSMEFALGELGFTSFRVAYRNKSEGKIIIRGSVLENISGLYNDYLSFTFDLSLSRGRAAGAISNPVMESSGGLFGGKVSNINMPEEYDAYVKAANGIFDNFERYVREGKPQKEFNSKTYERIGRESDSEWGER
jgi:hypothetical protein